MRNAMRVLLSALAVLLLSAAAIAQTTGSISGTVADKDGAVIPNAKITAIQQETKTITRSISNGEGAFTFAALTSGTYTVKIEATGFKTYEVKNLILRPGDKATVPSISMQLGVEGIVVDIDASTLAVDVKTSGDRAAVLDSKAIKNLALLGRDVSELTKTLPGFNTTTGAAGGKGFSNGGSYDPTVTTIGGGGSAVGMGYSANGTPFRGGGADLVSDGAHVIDPGCNCGSTQTINADMVAEVKVSTNSFSADSALGPVVIQAIGKSGGSQYNGNVYLHFRNGTMNANTYTNKANSVGRPSTHYYYPGGQVGGPVKIPGTSFNKDNKLFFWAGFEYYHQTFLSSSDNGLMRDLIPTDDEYAGLLDPTRATVNGALSNAQKCQALKTSTYSSSVGNYICKPVTSITTNENGGTTHAIVGSDISAYIAPGAKAYEQIFPHANAVPTGANPYDYVKSVIAHDNGWMFHGRGDYNFNETTKLNVSYNQQRDKSNVPVMLWWNPANSIFYPADLWTTTKSRTISGTFVKVLNPTLTNEFTGSFAKINIPYADNNSSSMYMSKLGYPYSGVLGISKKVPGVHNSWWSQGFGLPTMYAADIGDDSTGTSYYARKNLPTFSDNITKVSGNHTIKAGAYWTMVTNKQVNFVHSGGSAGLVMYSPNWSSKGAGTNVIGNWLLDYATSYTQTSNSVDDIAYKSFAMFIQDDWKMAKKLSLTLGLRASHDPSWYDHSGNNGMATWSEKDYNEDISRGLTSGPGLRYHKMDSSIKMDGRSVQPLFIAPRLGMSWDMRGNGKTILRGGFGTYYYHDQFNFYQSPAETGNGATTCVINSAGFLEWYQSNYGGSYTPSCSSSSAAAKVNGRNVMTAHAIDRYDDTQPLTYTYTAQLEQQMPFNTLLDIAYVGNQSMNQVNPWLNINAIPLKAFFSADPLTGKSFADNRDAIESDSNANGGTRNDYRPYTNYNTLDVLRHRGWDNYNAFQLTWTRTRGAFNFNLNYTWSKMLGLDNSNTDDERDPLNIHNNYGVLPQDRSHVINASFSYELGHYFKSNKILDYALGGWMISNISQWQSGGNMQAMYGGSRNFGFGAGLDGSTGYDGGPIPTSFKSNQFNINSIEMLGSSDYRLMPTLTCNPTKGLGKHQFFNPSCFGIPAGNGVNGSYQWPYIHGPAYWDTDLALQKTFKVTEKQNVQFKVSAFNFLNHPLWSFDNNNMGNINVTYKGYYSSATGKANYSLYNPSSSALGYVNTKFGQRTLELTLKYNF